MFLSHCVTEQKNTYHAQAAKVNPPPPPPEVNQFSFITSAFGLKTNTANGI